jgi:hypothetical protein
LQDDKRIQYHNDYMSSLLDAIRWGFISLCIIQELKYQHRTWSMGTGIITFPVWYLSTQHPELMQEGRLQCPRLLRMVSAWQLGVELRVHRAVRPLLHWLQQQPDKDTQSVSRVVQSGSSPEDSGHVDNNTVFPHCPLKVCNCA